MSRIKFSDHIPFEIQAEIMERLPVKSLVRFRSVAKPWKFLIGSSKFIKDHHIRQTQTQPPHLFFTCEAKDGLKCVSLIDDVTFPNQNFSHILPKSIHKFEYSLGYGSSQGVLCFFGYHQDLMLSMAVLWNPIVRKSVCVEIPTLSSPTNATVDIVVGFGVCHNTSDPKIVKIDVIHKKSTIHWKVDVFTLSSRVWKSLSVNPPFKLCRLAWFHVSVEGFVYWRGYGGNDGYRSNIIIFFELESEKFGEVSLPGCLVHSDALRISKLNETLVVFDYNKKSKMPICHVWIMDSDGVTKYFNKMFTVNELYHRKVLGFRKNGEAILERIDVYASDDDDDEEELTSMLEVSMLEVLQPCSDHDNDIGIRGQHKSFCVSSCTESLLLLNKSNSSLIDGKI